jgi:hypothetical protein
LAYTKIVKALRGFLRLTGYYGKKNHRHGILVRPLTDLLKKRVFILVGTEQEHAFHLLKETMEHAPPVFTILFSLKPSCWK